MAHRELPESSLVARSLPWMAALAVACSDGAAGTRESASESGGARPGGAAAGGTVPDVAAPSPSESGAGALAPAGTGGGAASPDTTCPEAAPVPGRRCLGELACVYEAFYRECDPKLSITWRCVGESWSATYPASCPVPPEACDVEGTWELAYPTAEGSAFLSSETYRIAKLGSGSFVVEAVGDGSFGEWWIAETSASGCTLSASRDATSIVDTGGSTCGLRGAEYSLTLDHVEDGDYTGTLTVAEFPDCTMVRTWEGGARLVRQLD